MFVVSSKGIQHGESVKYSTQIIQPVNKARKYCIHGQNCLRTCLVPKIKGYKSLMNQLGEHCNVVWKKGLTRIAITAMKRDLKQTRFDCFTLLKTLLCVLSFLMLLQLIYNKAIDQ